MFISATTISGSKQGPWGKLKALEKAAIAKIKEIMKSELSTQKRILGGIVATWNHEVVFDVQYEEIGGAMIYTISTDDEVFFYLDRGTSVRYATMTPDFLPKSKVRKLSSWPGQGGKKYVDRKRPRPGIQAREWMDELYTRRRPIYFGRMEKEVLEIIRRYWAS